MKQSKWFFILGGFLMIIVIFFAWIQLPVSQGQIWMSPDETANTQIAAQFAQSGNFFIPSALSSDFLWAHPRSFVFLPTLQRIVPVGFLGMSFVLALGYKLFGLLGILFFTPLLALITLFPLYKILPKSWSKEVKIFTLFIWMTFPAVIIYANRGAFAQLPITCLAIWIWWLVTSKKAWFKFILAGLLLGLIALIRPPEVIWAIPLTLAAFVYSQDRFSLKKIDKKAVLFILVPFLVIISMGALFGYQTYGKWFVSGYQMRPIVITDQNTADNTMTSGITNTASILDILPFSFHPRNILWNVKYYIVVLFWPWFISGLAGIFLLYKQKIWQTKTLIPILALLWACIYLIGFYGNGIYQDHVIVNHVSMGNSFLRYVLPLSVILTLCIGVLLDALWKKWTLKIFAVCLTIVLLLTGIWQAYAKDDEGVLENQRQIIRYNEIRNQAAQYATPDTYILSDRSDKIFFPYFNAVSPLPAEKDIYEFIKSGNKVQLYLTTQDEVGIIKWLDAGLRITPLFSNDNQTMYDVSWIDYDL